MLAEIGPFRRVDRNDRCSRSASSALASSARSRLPSRQPPLPLSRPPPGKRARNADNRALSSAQAKLPSRLSNGRRCWSSVPAMALFTSKLPASSPGWRSSGLISAFRRRRATGAPAAQTAGSTSASASRADEKAWRANGVSVAVPLPRTPSSATTLSANCSSGPSAVTVRRIALSSRRPAMPALACRGNGASAPSVAPPVRSTAPKRAPNSLRRCV